jgi:two-component system sensor histidine kinase KdpD
MSHQLQRFRSYLFAILLTAGATLVLWLLHDTLTLANFSLIYLLVVLIVAVSQGTRPSLLAALLGFLCFNFFLVRPFYTFLVSDPRDLLDLLVFFVSAAIAGQLASYARKQADDARQRAYEQSILYELAGVLNQATLVDEVHNSLKEVLNALSSVQSIQIFPEGGQTPTPNRVSLYVLLQAGEKIYGVLAVVFDTPPTTSLVQLVTACAAQVAFALQRIELAEHAQQRKNFEEADRLKTALLRAVSHDLRTPITIIKTSVSNLLTFHVSLPENERVDMLKTIGNEADQLNKMVGNLLDISRLEAGALQIHRELNSLEEVAGDVAARIWQLTHQERIKIDFPDTIPLVPFDYGLILQSLSNLVDNALRYEPEEKQVEISGSLEASEVHVAIRNHGPNIPPEERNLIMEPFHHGRGGNIGLGLVIAKGIIEAHCGRLWFEDTPGGGATFIFALPLIVTKGDGQIDEDSGCG